MLQVENKNSLVAPSGGKMKLHESLKLSSLMC